MAPICDLDSANLVAYTDGELHASRHEMVEAHLLHCQLCQRRIVEFAEVDSLIQAGTRLRRDPEAPIMLKQQRVQATEDRNRNAWRTRYWALLVALLAP